MKTTAQIQQDRDEERKRWLAVFPAEIWLLILDDISDVDTLTNLASASSWMTDMLRPKRNLYLFAPVLKILDAQQYLNFSDDQMKREKHFNLLHCRLVSSSWKNAVDDVLQLRPYHLDEFAPAHFQLCPDFYFSRRDENMFDPVYQALFSLYKFNIDTIKNSLLPELNSSYYQTNNPFLSRQLDLLETTIPGSRGNEILRSYRMATKHFLQTVGHHFWHVRIETCHLGSKWEPLEWYTQIRNYVEMMPNLRSLQIHSSFLESEMNAKVLSVLDRLTCDLPFPHLPHLSLLNSHQSPNTVINEIMSANRQLKIVNISAYNNMYFDDGTRCKINKLVNPEMVSTSINSLNELYEHLPEKWKLASIRLTFPEEGFFKWSQVFTKLESYRNTLKYVYLYILPREISEKQEKNLWKQSKIMLDLPNVKQFYMEIYNYCSFDFLLGLKSLESLEIRLIHGYDWQPSLFAPASDVIDYHGEYGNDFSKSNIWELIPSLQRALVGAGCNQMKKYTRNGK